MAGFIQRATLVCVAASLLLGCGGRGDISGKVMLDTKAIVTGTVTFIASDKQAYQGQIKEDGSYKVEKVPVGEAKILVDSPDPSSDAAGRKIKAILEDRKKPGDPPIKDDMPKIDPKKWVAISSDYQYLDKTPLTYQVKGGKNQHDIVLKAK